MSASPSRPSESLLRFPSPSVVCSHNEWDPLEECIVGVIDHATIPPWHVALRATMPEEQRALFEEHAGESFPASLIARAKHELDAFADVLRAEGVTVTRPDAVDHARAFSTPEWRSESGLYAAMPRDVLLVIGDEIIEAPMAWRCRYFEVHAYRALIKRYFRAGARWTAAPKPQLSDSFFDHDFADPAPGEPFRSVIGESEPTFDAADFVRFGRDIFGQLSNVTNAFGVEWLRAHLGPNYRVHVVDVEDTHPMHIDATMLPLAPGKLLVNPERLPRVPHELRAWDVLEAPAPQTSPSATLFMSSAWISMNVLSIDHERVVVERQQEPLIKKLRDWGFKPIPVDFTAFNAFGGSFHCATADVRRRGALRSYV
jgi:glycine amidinotransferase